MSNLFEYEQIDYLSGQSGVTEKIKKEIETVASSFVYIGFLLWEVKEYKYYLSGGFNDIYDYAEKELGFKKTSVKNFINICEKFSKRSDYNKPTYILQSSYKFYNYSQLTEMLSLSSAQLDAVAPVMTIKDIKELKKGQTSDLEQLTTDNFIDNSKTIDNLSKMLKVEYVFKSPVGASTCPEVLEIETDNLINLEFTLDDWSYENYCYISELLDNGYKIKFIANKEGEE